MLDLGPLLDGANRTAVILAELAGLLNEIGKLDPNFIASLPPRDTEFDTELERRTLRIRDFGYRKLAPPSELLVVEPLRSYLKGGARPPGTEPQVRVANAFKSFHTGPHVLNDMQQKKLGRLVLSAGGETWALSDLITLSWERQFCGEGGTGNPYALAAFWMEGEKQNWRLPWVLAMCHREGHHGDKEPEEGPEDAPDAGRGPRGEQQNRLDLRIATAFGYEREANCWTWKQLRDNAIGSIPAAAQEVVTAREAWIKALREALKQGLGDTNRPVNEITLWDYAAARAALFKSATAGSILEGKIPHQAPLKWRLAGIRLDGLDYRFRAHRAADIIARDEHFRAALEAIRLELESECPVGNEVYRDEHGAYYVVPAVSGGSEKDWERELEKRIKTALEKEGIEDFRAEIRAGEPLEGRRLNLGGAIGSHPVHPAGPPGAVFKSWWMGHAGNEICTVCGERPIGYQSPKGHPPYVTRAKMSERKICGVCLERRGRKSENWAVGGKRREGTIWTGEVADANGRIALLAGQFDLRDWMNGELAASLALGQTQAGEIVSKQANFARIQRIWRTTDEFWSEIEDGWSSEAEREPWPRLILEADPCPALGSFHAYELGLGGSRCGVVWCSGGGPPYLISAVNLLLAARQAGLSWKGRQTPARAAEELLAYLTPSPGKPLPLYEASYEAGKPRFPHWIRVNNTRIEESRISRHIRVLRSPSRFLCLVPADQALKRARRIAAKFEEEMAWVRNRLPFRLGIVFSDVRTPLRAVLDAGKRFLEAEAISGTWEVTGISPESGGCRKIRVQRGEKTASWACDPKGWYASAKKVGRPGWTSGVDLAVHDRIAFDPARFDFLWLDTAGRRFEMPFRLDAGRGYLLDQMERFERLWTRIADGKSGLSTHQVNAMMAAIEEARTEWAAEGEDDDFQQFCNDVLTVADWGDRPAADELGKWAASAARGELADALEIYMKVLKLRPERQER